MAKRINISLRYFSRFLRLAYYRLSPGWRFKLRKWLYFPFDLVSPPGRFNGIQLPPRSLIYTGSGNFLETGQKFVSLFNHLHLIRQSSNVLDIGCGLGRIAIPLTDQLKDIEGYQGVDIIPEGIKWCKENIESSFPNFRFHLVDVKNELYRKEGLPASSFRFPFESHSFDLCILISVFTHMLPDEMESYVLEITRLLKMGGNLFITGFFYENDEILSTNCFEVFHRVNKSHAVMDKKLSAGNVAFALPYFEELVTRNGFVVKNFFKGSWRCEQNATDFQDIVVLSKKA